MVNPALAPATIGAVGSAVLSTLTSGHCTAMVAAVELLFRVLVSLLEATFAEMPVHVVPKALEFIRVLFLSLVAPLGSVPKLQVSVVPPFCVVGPQRSVVHTSELQSLRCLVCGLRLESNTAVEGPVPPAVTTMVNPALAPATIGAVGSAVLSTLTSGHCTAMVAAVELLFRVLVSLLEATLVVLLLPLLKSALFPYTTLFRSLVAPLGSVPKLQVSVVPPFCVVGPQ